MDSDNRHEDETFEVRIKATRHASPESVDFELDQVRKLILEWLARSWGMDPVDYGF